MTPANWQILSKCRFKLNNISGKYWLNQNGFAGTQKSSFDPTGVCKHSKMFKGLSRVSNRKEAICELITI